MWAPPCSSANNGGGDEEKNGLTQDGVDGEEPSDTDMRKAATDPGDHEQKTRHFARKRVGIYNQNPDISVDSFLSLYLFYVSFTS